MVLRIGGWRIEVGKEGEMRQQWFWSGVVVGAAVLGGLLYRWLRLALPWRAWQRLLEHRHGVKDGRRLRNKAQREYHALLAAYPRPLPAAPLREHLVDTILPGLAIYRVLLAAHGGDRAATLEEVEILFYVWTKASYGGLMRFFAILPHPFWLFSRATKKRMDAFPAAIWQTRWVERSARRIAFHNFACPYLEVLSAYGARELTAAFCHMDDYLAEMLPGGITFRRTQSQAEGAAFCDYSYRASA